MSEWPCQRFPCSVSKSTGSTSCTWANVFDFGSGEQLNELSFVTWSKGDHYALYYAPVIDGVPSTDESTWVSLAEGTIEHAGYTTVASSWHDIIPSGKGAIVLKVTYGDVSLLLTGDAEAKTEMLLVGAYGAEKLKADVLKLGHHGSRSSSCAAFLNAVGAKYALASLGKDNDYGHPHESVLNRLAARGMTLYRTDESGCVAVFTDGTRVCVVP